MSLRSALPDARSWRSLSVHVGSSTEHCSASWRTPSLKLIGLRRTRRPSSSSSPKAFSVHAASGDWMKVFRSCEGNGVSTAVRICAMSGAGTRMARRRDSSTTFSGGIVVPNSLVATSAAARRRSSRLPPLASVALVPMFSSFMLPLSSRRRRISMATSAP